MMSSSDVAKPWQSMGSPPTGFKPKKPFMPRLSRAKNPDHVIGFGSTIQGRFEFRGLLKVEGRFEGVLRAIGGGNVVVSRSGVIMGDVEGCHSVVVEGTVIGNIVATNVDLRRHAFVEGDVCCNELVAAATAAFRNRQEAMTTGGSFRRRSTSPSPSSQSSSTFEQGANNANKSGAAGSSGGGGGTGNSSPSRGSSEEHTVVSSATEQSASAIAFAHALHSAQEGELQASGGVGAAAGSTSRSAHDIAVAVRSAFPVQQASLAASRSPKSTAVAAHSVSSPGIPSDVGSRSLDSSSSNHGSGGGAIEPPAKHYNAHLNAHSDNAHENGGNGVGGGVGASVTHTTNNRGENRVVDRITNYSMPQNSQIDGTSSPRDPAATMNNKDAPFTPPPPSRGGGGGGSTGSNSGGSAVPNESQHTSVQTLHEHPPADSTGAVAAAVTWPAATGFSGMACPCGHGVDSGGRGRFRGAGYHQENHIMGVDVVPSASAEVQEDVAKRYGLKTKFSSLTRAFASVAILLQFDEDLIFEEHLQLEYAAENLWFWKRAMKYRATYFQSVDQRRAEATRIYKCFLAADAPDQVNISFEDRESVKASLENRPGAQAVGAGLFDEAIIQVESMLALGPFPRFASGTVKNVESSWAMVVDRFSFEEAGESFYTMLFDIAPGVESLFMRSKRVQAEMLIRIVDASVKLLSNLQDLVPALIQLGLRHSAYKVKPEHFAMVGEALVATLSFFLGEEFTQEIRQSWLAVYTLMSNVMVSVLETPGQDEPDAEHEGDPTVGGTYSFSSSATDVEAHSKEDIRDRGMEGILGVGAGGTEGAAGGGEHVSGGQEAVSGAVGGRSRLGASARGMYRRRTLSIRKHFPRILVRKDNSAPSSAQMASPTPTSTTSTNASTTPASKAATSVSSAATNGGGGGDGNNGQAAAGGSLHAQHAPVTAAELNNMLAERSASSSMLLGRGLPTSTRSSRWG